MYPTFETFQAAVEAAGLQAVKRSPTHWQVIGRFRVNYYPAAKRGPTAYVNGTHAGTYCSSIADVVRMATEPPPVAGKRANRKKNTRRAKARLLRKDPHCYWCRAPLTRETATLEHIIPLARGGSNGSDNLTIACRGCNADRGHDMPEVFAPEYVGKTGKALIDVMTGGTKTPQRK